MIFQYGTYQHANNEIGFESVVRQLTYTDRGYPEMMQETWALKGRKRAATQATLLSDLGLLRTAYSVNGYTAVLLDDNGAETLFKLDTTQARGGVRVLNPVSHTSLIGSQLATICDYTISLQADYPITGAITTLAFEETLSFDDIGGGPISVEIQPANGTGIIQDVTEKSFYYCTQTGSLESLQRDPSPAAQLFPDKLRRQPGSKVITKHSPPQQAGAALRYGVQWSYQYISTSPMNGVPSNPN